MKLHAVPDDATVVGQVESLEKLPERMDSLELQFMQFREEVRAEFSATRAELRAEIRAGDEQTRVDLRAEIRAGDEETRTFMRVLHEEVLSRIALLDERWNGSAVSRRLSKARQRKKKS